MLLYVSLQKLECYAAARKFVERISTVGTLGIKHCECLWKFFAYGVVVANNHIDALAVGVVDFLVALDAAIYGDEQGSAVFGCVIDSLRR